MALQAVDRRHLRTHTHATVRRNVYRFTGASSPVPVTLSAATLTGTSAINTNGSIQSKGLLSGSVVALGVSIFTGLGDGATVQLTGSTSTFHLTTNAIGGTPTITLAFSSI